MVLTFVPSDAAEAAEWRAALESLSADAVEIRKALLARAHDLASAIPARSGKAAIEVDVVVSGCGFLVNYFLGVHSVLAEIEARGDLTLCRYAGASSGAKTPVHLILAGDATTIDHHLAYGALCARRGGSTVHAAFRNDRCALVTLDHLFATCERQLPRLDGRAHICVAQHTWRGPRRVTLSRFCDDNLQTARQRLREYWHATGTLLTRVDGLGFCSDGGVAGNCPLFEDGARAQLLVQPQRRGLPKAMVFAYTPEQAVRAIEMGQDDAAELVTRWWRCAADGATPEAAGGGALSVVPCQRVRRE